MEYLFAAIISSVIAFCGVVLTLIITNKRSKSLIDAEFQKIKTQILQSYGDRILQKRMEIYPLLYSILSSFQKKVQFGKLTVSDVSEFKNKIEEWDSPNALFLSDKAQRRVYDFRKYVNTELVKMSNQELNNKDFLEQLRIEIRNVETILKNDIGIYKWEYSDAAKEISDIHDL